MPRRGAFVTLSRWSLQGLSGLFGMAATVALAAPPETAPAPTGQPLEIESCVSKDRIRIAHDHPRAALDAGDHAALRREMMRRYPVVAGDGFPVSRILLWQPTRRAPLFITVIDHPGKPGLACFTATFTAERFDDFRRLQNKYLQDD